jgi:hypothetical protein
MLANECLCTKVCILLVEWDFLADPMLLLATFSMRELMGICYFLIIKPRFLENRLFPMALVYSIEVALYAFTVRQVLYLLSPSNA